MRMWRWRRGNRRVTGWRPAFGDNHGTFRNAVERKAISDLQFVAHPALGLPLSQSTFRLMGGYVAEIDARRLPRRRKLRLEHGEARAGAMLDFHGDARSEGSTGVQGEDVTGHRAIPPGFPADGVPRCCYHLDWRAMLRQWDPLVLRPMSHVAGAAAGEQ